jgi:hypothetical protein
MASGQSRNRLYQLVRDFSVQTPAWGAAVRYFTLPDERLDLTLVSQRVYGNRNEALVIQAAAGLDSPELAMTERALVLPTATRLMAMKLQAGYGE